MKGGRRMDIEKIINDSGNEWENDIANGKFDYFKKYPKLSESSVASSISMQYSEILLKNYHEQLRKELSKHGVDL